jgi:hypothetical protein
MGLFGGGNSSTANNTQNTSVNNSVAKEIASGAQALGVAGDDNTVSFLDGGAIAGSFAFGKNAIDTLDKNSEYAFDFVGASQNSALKFASNALDEATKSNNQSTAQALNFATNAAKTAEQQTTAKLVGYIPIIAVVGGLIFLLKGK